MTGWRYKLIQALQASLAYDRQTGGWSWGRDWGRREWLTGAGTGMFLDGGNSGREWANTAGRLLGRCFARVASSNHCLLCLYRHVHDSCDLSKSDFVRPADSFSGQGWLEKFWGSWQVIWGITSWATATLRTPSRANSVISPLMRRSNPSEPLSVHRHSSRYEVAKWRVLHSQLCI